jgi:iduronate 2-sulfatase
VSYIDDLVGKILRQLTATGLDKDTLIVFTSDHGFHLGEQGMWRKKTNFESAVKVPLMIKIPGLTESGHMG